MRKWIFTALLVMTAAGAARAEDANDCGKFKWSVERERAWILSGPTPVAATSEITLGERAYRVTLAATDTIKFPAPPERAPKPGTHAGLLTFTVANPGAYDIALSGEGWIDVAQNGALVKSSDFSGQKNCPGVRKSVRFPLSAGPATLQLSNIAADTIDVAIAPAP
jgi:hypothetical protein